MTALPRLTDEERAAMARDRAEMARQQQEDRDQESRLFNLLETARQAIEDAQKEMRRPLDSVRWTGTNDSR